MPGYDLAGNDIPGGKHAEITNAADCLALCMTTQGCTHLTFIYSICFLKDSAAGAKLQAAGLSADCSAANPSANVNSAVKDEAEHVPPAGAVQPSDGGSDQSPTETQAHTNTKGNKLAYMQGNGKGANGPASIYEAQGASVCGKLYVFGGFVNGFKKMQKDTYEYDPQNNKWTVKKPIPADYQGLTHAANAWDESTCTIYIVGGLANKNGGQWPGGAFATKDTFAYNAKKDTWQTLPELPAARGGSGAVVYGNKLYYVGGAAFNGGFVKDYGTHWVLDLANTAAGWKVLPSFPTGRNHLGVAAFNNHIYAIGGQFYEDEGCSNQKLVHKFNLKTNKWSRAADLPIGLGHISPATLANDKGIILVGGASNKGSCHPPGKHLSNVYFYNPTDDKWTTVGGKYSGGSMVSGLIGGTIYSQHGRGLHKQSPVFGQNSGRTRARRAAQQQQQQQSTVSSAHGAREQLNASTQLVVGIACIAGLVVGAIVLASRTWAQTRFASLSAERQISEAL